MKPKWLNRLALLAALSSTCMAYDPGADDITTVSSRASSDYIRVRQANGTYAAETYAFGNGGVWPGDMKDDSFDKVEFLEVGHMIAYPLAGQHYYPSTDPNRTNLLIMVYWGTTRQPPPQASQMLIQMVVRRNIRMLGYESWYNQTNMDLRGTALQQHKTDLYVEIGENRYFVVLMAYDFQLLWKEKKHRLLWETRFSLRQHFHEFDKELPSMALYASRYFGEDTGGLIHEPVPKGNVEIGSVKSLGEVPQK